MAVLNFDIKSVNLPNGEEAKAVFLSGSIDASTNQTFEGRLNEILNSGTNKVLLVLTNVKYINSTGLGTIVKCVDTFREKDGDIKLVGVPTKVIALFEMLGLLALFETYETIEDAVGSFVAAPASGAAGSSASAASPAVSFPLQFKHPVTGMGLNVNAPGRFKDPRTGDYFSVDSAGTIEFYQTGNVAILDLKVPCDPAYTPGVISLATALARKIGLGPQAIAAVEAAIDEACSLIARNDVGSAESCHLLVVGDNKRLQVGFVTHSGALDAASDDPCLIAIGQHMDQVVHKPLPGRGHLLSMSKKVA